MSNNKGIILPIVLFFISFFLLIPIVFFYFNSSGPNLNVKGVSTEVTNTPGLEFNIASDGGPWDLYVFLCTTKDECISDLMAGKKLRVSSGGSSGHGKVFVEHSSDFDSFELLKVFIKPAWGTTARNFRFGQSDLIDSIENISYESQNYEVLLIKPENFNNTRVTVPVTD